MLESQIQSARVLIVDDQAANIFLLQSLLAQVNITQVKGTTDPRETVRLVGEFEPDLILLDLNMPHLNGVEVLLQLQRILPEGSFLPVLILTGETSGVMRRRALANGATDLLSKPFDSAEVVVRIRNLLRTRFLHQEVAEQNVALEKKVVERTRALEDTMGELKATQAELLQQARLHAFAEMAGGVVHDFNNALMAVIGYSELLLNTPDLLDDRATVLEFLQVMNGSGRDASHVVSRLRDFYRPRNISDLFASLNLNDLVEKMVPATQPKWKDQALAEGRVITVELDLEKLPLINGNESELRGLLTNLIFNAVDAMPQGGTITIRTRRHEGGAMLEVIDSGIGMTDEVRAHCLEPFFSTKGEKGTGLGLSMVFGIVQRHNASIDLRSVVGEGTTFILAFPPAEAPAGALVAPAVQAERPLQILVVDDEPITRDIVSRFLRLDGHTVTTVADGADALFACAKQNFDLILTDHGMPSMSGLQLAAAAKIMCDELPVILLTGFGHTGLKKEEALAEVDVVLSKPVPQAALRQAVADAMPQGSGDAY